GEGALVPRLRSPLGQQRRLAVADRRADEHQFWGELAFRALEPVEEARAGDAARAEGRRVEFRLQRDEGGSSPLRPGGMAGRTLPAAPRGAGAGRSVQHGTVPLDTGSATVRPWEGEVACVSGKRVSSRISPAYWTLVQNTLRAGWGRESDGKGTGLTTQ